MTDNVIDPPGREHSLQRLEAIVGLEQLEREFGDAFSQQTIEKLFADSLKTLESARVTAFTPVFAERLTRERLRALASQQHAIPGVLFLCVHNAGRSQMAAAWLRMLGDDRVHVYSAGSEPASDLNTAVVEAMNEVGISLADEFPKPWTDEVLGAVQTVVTMGCGDTCPIYPGVRYVDWELDDPAEQDVATVRRIRDDIEQRVRALLVELDVAPTISEPR